MMYKWPYHEKFSRIPSNPLTIVSKHSQGSKKDKGFSLSLSLVAVMRSKMLDYERHV